VVIQATTSTPSRFARSGNYTPAGDVALCLLSGTTVSTLLDGGEVVSDGISVDLQVNSKRRSPHVDPIDREIFGLYLTRKISSHR
jgi:hypothetical protein